MRVGVAGYGKMGSAMAARLIDSGFDVVVWNRELERVRAAGLPLASTARNLAQTCEVVISSLFDADAVQAVYGDADGLIAGGRETLFIETSTVAPATQQALSHKVTQGGGAFVECPVSGTTGPARMGQLVGFPGGSSGDVKRARPVLEKLCRRIEHVGPVGADALTKLAVNLPLIVFWQSFGEAMALMRHLGKGPDWLVHLFADTAGAPVVMKVKADAIAATLAGEDKVPATFDIDSMRKDLQLMLAEAQSGAFPLPVVDTVLRSMDEASAAGWGKRDCAWMPAFWAAKASKHAVSQAS